MKTRFPVWLLIVGGPVTSLPAQSPPANPNHPPPIQKMLNTPVWYLNYMVRLEANGSDGLNPGSHSLHRATSGRMMLGIRSSGPSLSVILNPTIMQITSGDQLHALVGNYANWVHGPPLEDRSLPPNQRKTEAEADAYFARVREENMLAHQRYSYEYSGGADHTRESGSATVQHIGEPALEFDAVSRKYRFMWDALAHTDSAANANPWPVTGTKETGIGTIHYKRQDIQSGMYPKEAIESITPPINFEGALPGSGNISYSSVHAIQLGPGLAHGLRGTLSVQFTLSPDPPAPVELIIEPPAKYEQWRPIGSHDEKSTGDLFPVRVVLQKPDGTAPQFKAVRFNYFLRNTSREKGVCLNWPPQPDPANPYDLQFEEAYNTGLSTLDSNRQVAIQSGHGMVEGTVNVSCFDYGAHGEFEAFAELENGQVVYGVVKGTANQPQLLVPARNPNSTIAKVFLRRLAGRNLKDDDDTENDPVGDGFKGDGLTLYEEYRGFKNGDDWTPGDPKKKDVFVLNQMRSHPFVARGIKLFETATTLRVHQLLRDDQVNANMEINFHRTAGPHVVDQHVIRIKAAPGGQGYAEVEEVGTPGTAKSVSMPPTWGWLNVVRGRAYPYFAATLAHEMLHDCNVYHHGEQDKKVSWSVVPGGLQIYEQEVNYNEDQQRYDRLGASSAITVKKENGTVIQASDIFPAGKNEVILNLGMAHGQHSGHENCLMRYDNSFAYPSKTDPTVRYLSDGETTGLGLCVSAAGTGVNASGPDPAVALWHGGHPRQRRPLGGSQAWRLLASNPRQRSRRRTQTMNARSMLPLLLVLGVTAATAQVRKRQPEDLRPYPSPR